MKVKKQRLIIRAISLMISLLMISTVGYTSAEGTATDSDTVKNTGALFLKKGSYANAGEMLSDMTSVQSSDGIELYYNKDTADIAVRDGKGNIWLSSPFDYKNDTKASDEIKSQMASFIRLTYYDNQSNMYEMNGYDDCIAKNQFDIEEIKNGIRVNMSIGKDEAQVSLPFAIEAERFEEKIIGNLSGIAKRRVEAFYTKYSSSDDTLDSGVKERLLNLYPGLSDYDFYILRDDASDRDKQLLTEYITSTPYSNEDYADDLSKSGSADEATAAASFKLSVEFTLENGCLSVNVPADKISYDKNSFVLNKIRLLEYFGAGKSSNNGYLFIPDGSGSLINFNTDSSKKILSIACQVYGNDYTLLQNEEYKNISQQTYLPVFGIKEADKAFFAVIEDGDAMAQIISESGNIISGYETVAMDFTYSTVQTYLYNDGKKQNGQWTYFDKNYYDGSYRVKYYFLNGDKADYSGMAECYRNYLKQNGVLKKAENSSNIPLYIETVGLITRKDTFLGIPYNRKIDITNFEEAEIILKELNENGVENISLRYKGWMNGGLNSTVSSKPSVEKKLGGTKGLKALNEYLTEKDFAFFPEVSFNIVRRNTLFDGFAPLFDSPRSNDDNISYIIPPEELNNISDKQNKYASVSPVKTSKYYKSFFGKYSSLGINGTALLYTGNMLYSDFSKDNGTTRQQSLEILRKNIENNVAGKTKIMTDGGNAYIYPYAEDILSMPSSDGGNITEDESIPFMQMVLHGSIRYAGEPVNLSSNWKTELLKSAEYGAGLYFTLGYKNIEYLKDTTLSYLYSVDYQTWKNDIITLYKKYNSVFSQIQNCEIISHERISENVYKTVYENGTAVIVNYNDSDVAINGINVGAMDFSVSLK